MLSPMDPCPERASPASCCVRQGDSQFVHPQRSAYAYKCGTWVWVGSIGPGRKLPRYLQHIICHLESSSLGWWLNRQHAPQNHGYWSMKADQALQHMTSALAELGRVPAFLHHGTTAQGLQPEDANEPSPSPNSIPSPSYVARKVSWKLSIVMRRSWPAMSGSTWGYSQRLVPKLGQE